jgi:hypothetical protein
VACGTANLYLSLLLHNAQQTILSGLLISRNFAWGTRSLKSIFSEHFLRRYHNGLLLAYYVPVSGGNFLSLWLFFCELRKCTSKSILTKNIWNTTIFNVIWWVDRSIKRSSHRPMVQFFNIFCKIPLKIISIIFYYLTFSYNLKESKIYSLLTVWNALRPSHQPLFHSQTIKIMFGPSDGGTIVPSTHRAILSYWRLSDFWSKQEALWTTNKYALKPRNSYIAPPNVHEIF